MGLVVREGPMNSTDKRLAEEKKFLQCNATGVLSDEQIKGMVGI